MLNLHDQTHILNDQYKKQQLYIRKDRKSIAATNKALTKFLTNCMLTANTITSS